MTFGGDHPDELISASLTGDLTAAERAELDAHLARCDRCLATLAAFKAERRILSGLPTADPPRDLAARVRAGVKSGRLGVPWWRRPGSSVPLFGSAAVFAAVVLGVVYFGKLHPGPVGQASESPEATLSSAPSASVGQSLAPSVGPSAPATFLGAGQLGYFELGGAPFEAGHLAFINDATGASIDLGVVSGPPTAASLSPDGQWLAYITQKGETGANEVWAVHLTDGAVTALGCSLAAPFTDRLAWAAFSDYLAFTVAGVDLGPGSGCQSSSSAAAADVWTFDVRHAVATQLTKTGDGYAGGFQYTTEEGGEVLSLSHAAGQPWTGSWEVNGIAAGQGNDHTVNVFVPLLAPDASRALFWSGSLVQFEGGAYAFMTGGMPQLSGDFRSTGPASPWVGTPLFTDLVPYGGEAFAYGKFTWGPDSDSVAFWDGAWTGVPQSADGKYPSQQDVYVGSVRSGLLSSASRLPLTLDPNAWIVDVTFTPDGLSVAVTIGLPSAGIGDPPSAYLQIVPLYHVSGEPRTIGGGVNPPPWDGPAVYGH